MKTLGKYQLLDELGQGPMGTVYRALDPFRNQEIALKVLPSVAGLSAEAKAQLLREVLACADLQHPLIPKIVDMGEAEGSTYVARELQTGIDLRRCLQERPTLARHERLKLLAQVCDALAAAHRKQIVHGNIKPGNILVAADGDARVLDFGTSSIPPAEGRQRLPNYVAPEQILGQPADARSDVFAAAVVAYEFISGVYPFQAQPGLIPREIVHTEPAPLRTADAQIPEELERLLQRALDKNPQTRLQTAEEFSTALYAVARQLQAPPAVQPQAPPVAVAPPPPPPIAEPPVVLPPPVMEPPSPATANPAAVEASLKALFEVQPPKPVEQPKPQPVKSAPVPASKQPTAKPKSHTFTYVAAALLGISIIGALLSRQNSNASPTSTSSQEPSSSSAAPAPAATAAPAPAVEIAKPVKSEPRPEDILANQVTPLWEQGQYTQAMKLVDSILARHPNDADARDWKKRIREAQDAEAAIK